MKEKNKLKLFLVFLMTAAFMCGIGNIKAKTYNTYNRGNKITINLNDSTKLDFYVIEDSDKDNNKVIALAKSFTDNNTYTFDEASALLLTKKSEWNNVLNVDFATAKQLVGSTPEFSDSNSKATFTEPGWVSNEGMDFTTYWLKDIAQDGSHMAIYGADTHYNTQFHVILKDDTEKIYTRFLVETTKENVVGGVIEDENDKAWDAFVEAFGKTDIMKTMKESSNIVVSSTDSTLKIKLVYNNNTYESSFTYANGILKYVPSTSSLEDAPLVDSLWIANSLYALCAVKNYDIEKVQAWLEENTNLKIDTDGIEFVEKEVNITENGEWGDLNMSSTAFSKFELNIVDGLKTYKPLPLDNNEQTTPNKDSQTTLDDITENPKTGAGLNIVLVIVLLLVGAGIVISAKKKDIFKRI